MNNALFYEIESIYLDKKRMLLDFDSDFTIKEFLDKGFNNSYIYLKYEDNGIPVLKTFNLGYKDSENNYYSEDFSLNDRQLKCKVKIEEWDTDSDNFTIVYVSLKNKSDARYFINKKGVCK